ncbi:MAG: VCBS repeat-containing protein [Verrucomicrobia bacterium]|nr:VCBS repeat-containing protein [Verrucomicrobiota bacterium]
MTGRCRGRIDRIPFPPLDLSSHLPDPSLPPDELLHWAESRQLHQWPHEKSARSLDQEINNFWGRLRNSPGDSLKLEFLPDFITIELPSWSWQKIPGTDWYQSHNLDPIHPFSRVEFLDWLRSAAHERWTLSWSEWRLTRFLPVADLPNHWAASIQVRLHLNQLISQPTGTQTRRLMITGTIQSTWKFETTTLSWTCLTLDARGCVGLRSDSPPVFRSLMKRSIPMVAQTGYVDPLIVQDINGDGFVDVALATRNLLLLNNGDHSFDSFQLAPGQNQPQTHAILADFDNDSHPDYLAVQNNGLFLQCGLSVGGFSEKPETAWLAPQTLRNVMSLATADLDGDGDLDLWVGQYKIPFHRGQMPTPFFDANDGFKSWILENTGNGKFITKKIPDIEKKAHRRNYTAALVDLDRDGDIDLATFNDFSGVDIFMNLGDWNFSDSTDTYLDNPHLFGMGHGLSDWNRDAQLDIFALGMHSNVPTRLHEYPLPAGPPGPADIRHHMHEMNSGNRLYLSSPDAQSLSSHHNLTRHVADAGWAWGMAAPDFNLDGFPDFYITNGHRSRRNSLDYDNHFWTRDLFLANSTENPHRHEFFKSQAEACARDGMSYGGYFSDRLFLNQSGESAIEVSWLAGIELTGDSRNVAFTDVDNDGDHDLILVTEPSWLASKHTLHILENTSPPGNWIAFDLRHQAGSPIPFGAQILLESQSHRTVRAISSSDSFRTQPDPIIRLGLGSHPSPFSLSYTTTRGQKISFADLVPGRIHRLPIPR